jgi:hypothetical protein
MTAASIRPLQSVRELGLTIVRLLVVGILDDDGQLLPTPSMLDAHLPTLSSITH